MTPTERNTILDQLQSAKAALAAELAGLSDAQVRYRPEPGRWSILDCVEHIAVAEAAMYILVVRQSVPSEPGEGREEKYLKHSTNRSRKFSAPEGMHPTGRYPSLTAAWQTFLECRDRTIRYIGETEDDLRARKTMHPAAGEVTCRECLALMIGHPLRHAGQIREIKASPGFPPA
jgi:uncharacterized damage-inducible protein DinB